MRSRMSTGVSLGDRKSNGKEESELGEARKLREKGILMLGGGGLGRVNEFGMAENRGMYVLMHLYCQTTGVLQV